jgi:response regulator of citrate/malate metabolism
MMKKILISGIKDDSFYIDVLEKNGYVVARVIMNPAKPILEEHQPEAIILGTCVDSENGVDIIKETKNYNKEIKIIVIGKTEVLKVELMREGADVFLIKPVTSEQLLKAVEK